MEVKASVSNSEYKAHGKRIKSVAFQADRVATY